jgi:hypothetical protein
VRQADDHLSGELQRLSAAVVELRAAISKDQGKESEAKPRKKDAWDKSGIVAQFLSGVLIGTLGVIVTLTVNRAQQGISHSQLEIQNRQESSGYLKDLVVQTDPQKRAELVAALDTALQPQDAVPIAMHYAQPIQNQAVAREAIAVLRRLAKQDLGKQKIRSIASGAVLPDSDIAKAILGDDIRIRARASQIDDFGDLILNVIHSAQYSAHSERIVPQLTLGQDSGWIDFTDKLQPRAENVLEFLVTNGKYGGFNGRLQISMGTQQYDSGIVGHPEGPPYSGPAFYILVHIVAGDSLTKDGSVTVQIDPPIFYDKDGRLPGSPP